MGTQLESPPAGGLFVGRAWRADAYAAVGRTKKGARPTTSGEGMAGLGQRRGVLAAVAVVRRWCGVDAGDDVADAFGRNACAHGSVHELGELGEPAAGFDCGVARGFQRDARADGVTGGVVVDAGEHERFHPGCAA